MKIEDNTKGQLINELVELRRRVAELEKEKSETQIRRSEGEQDLICCEAPAADERVTMLESIADAFCGQCCTDEDRSGITTILESVTDAFLALDQKWRVTYMNPKAEQLLRKKRSDLIGRIYWDVFPDIVDTVSYRELHRAVAENITVKFEQFYPPLDTWFEARGFPYKKGISVFFRDITQRKRAEEELRRSNAELEQFAYIASHDETRGKPFELTDCEAVLEQAITNLKMAIEENKAIVTHDPLPIVMADATQMVQLLQNLIGNGIKFRKGEPPRVHVSAERKGNEWIISVQDNGIGISPEFFGRIFQLFQREYTSEYPGTGIGLAICKRIVERPGGRIWVESEAGRGSAFYFTIPVRRGE